MHPDRQLRNSDGSTAMTGFLGGGLYNVGNATVQDTTVSGNLAAGDGGGIYNNSGATLTLSGSTVTGNQYADVFNLGNLVQKDSTVGYLVW